MSFTVRLLSSEIDREMGKLRQISLRYRAKDQRNIMQKAAREVAKSARKGVKFGGQTGRRKGYGPRVREVGGRTYNPGNLKFSLQSLSFRKSLDGFVGPRFAKGKTPESTQGAAYGPPSRKTDGYYAAMVYGSAKAFQLIELIPALKRAKSTALSIVKKESEKALLDHARAVGVEVK